MKLVFAGTPEFARLAFDALLAAGHEIPLVLTQPDRPAGRGLKLAASPVKQAALAAGAQVLQPRSLRLDGRYPDEAADTQAALAALQPDAIVVAAYGLILPAWVLQLPRLGCLNIHASLLPRWRGAAPIQRAIEAGDATTGIAIMQMDEGLDTGDVLLEHVVAIAPDQTAGELHDVLAATGAQAITEALAALAGAGLVPRPQPDTGITYAAKLDKAEARLGWSEPAALLARRIRAFNPVPGATLTLPGLTDPVKVLRSQALDTATAAAPGTVLRVAPEGIDVATGHGCLRLQQLQKAGGKPQTAEVFARGWRPDA